MEGDVKQWNRDDFHLMIGVHPQHANKPLAKLQETLDKTRPGTKLDSVINLTAKDHEKFGPEVQEALNGYFDVIRNMLKDERRRSLQLNNRNPDQNLAHKDLKMTTKRSKRLVALGEIGLDYSLEGLRKANRDT